VSKNHASKKTIAAICISSLLVIGCAGGGGSITDAFNNMASSGRLNTYSKVIDKPLVDAFYSLSQDGKQQSLTQDFTGTPFRFEDLSPSSLSISQRIASVGNMSDAISTMNSYIYEGESDLLAKKYISVAKSRGNIVKLYKPKMGQIINNNFKQPFTPGQQTREWYGLDNALIEYDKTGKIVSFMARAHQAITTIGVRVYQYTTIYMGPGNSRHLENNTKNSDFQEYFVREL